MQKKKKFENMPTHVAMIMDGNRRWATRKGLNKLDGHKAGGKALKNLMSLFGEYEEIKYVSFFAFSTENWNRSQKEIDSIFDIAYHLIEDNKAFFKKNNIKFVAMGDVSKFPDNLKNALVGTMEETKNNTGLVVNLAMNYGGRDDIVQAVNKLIENGNKSVDVESIKQNLYSAGSPDIDLLIRTSGEMRISNFMLFQMAYRELYFTKVCWPDFDKKQLDKALKAYSKRNRRFGGK